MDAELLKAVSSRDAEAVRVLGVKGADLGGTDASGDTLLHLAVKALDRDCAVTLAMLGANLKAKDAGGRTVFDILMKDQPPAEDEHAYDGWKCSAAGRLCSDLISIEIAKDKAEHAIKTGEVGGRSGLLAEVCARGLYSHARKLLDLGRPVDESQECDKVTPLMAACALQFPELVELLVTRGADVNARDAKKRTPLLHALWTSSFSWRYSGEPDTRILGLLLDRGADIEAADEGGRPPIVDAAYSKYPRAAAFLASRGARTSFEDRSYTKRVMKALAQAQAPSPHPCGPALSGPAGP